MSILSDGSNINQITLPIEYTALMGGICADANNKKANDFELKVSTYSQHINRFY